MVFGLAGSILIFLPRFDVAGRENNMGLASWLGRISQDDAALVKIFRKSGAVIYTRMVDLGKRRRMNYSFHTF